MSTLATSQAQADYRDLCGTIHTPAIAEALERARVVGVLDAWVLAGAGGTRTCEVLAVVVGETWVLLKERGEPLAQYSRRGDTLDAARAAAARAIESGEVG